MTTASNLRRGLRYLAELIQHALWLYFGFSLSLRTVELILPTRGVVVSLYHSRAWHAFRAITAQAAEAASFKGGRQVVDGPGDFPPSQHAALSPTRNQQGWANDRDPVVEQGQR